MLKILLLLTSLNQGLSGLPHKLNLAQPASLLPPSEAKFTGFPKCEEGSDTNLCTTLVPSACAKGQEKAKFLKLHNLLNEEMGNTEMMVFSINQTLEAFDPGATPWRMVIREQENFPPFPSIAMISSNGILRDDHEHSYVGCVSHFDYQGINKKKALKKYVLKTLLDQRSQFDTNSSTKINIEYIFKLYDDFFDMLLSNKTDALLAKTDIKMACFRKPGDEQIVNDPPLSSKFASPSYFNQSATFNFHSVRITPETATWFASREIGLVGDLFMESFLLEDGEELVVIYGYVLQ